MSGSRSAFRHRLDLAARVHLGGDPTGLLARSVNLSRTGMGVRLDLPYTEGHATSLTPSPRSGDPLRVALYDEVGGTPLVRQWTGRVSHANVGCGGGRIGIAFEWPRGRGARSRDQVESSREKPSPWPLEDRREPAPELGALAPALALAGLAADQLSKVWATAASVSWPEGWRELGAGIVAIAPSKNPGALGSLADGFEYTGPICAAACLTLMGLAPKRKGLKKGSAHATGFGLLAAGMLGNSADRLLLGHVRDFLVLSALPNLTFNLADVLIVAGAASLLMNGKAGTKSWDSRDWSRV